MHITRRHILRLGAAASPLLADRAWAQGYPARPVKVLVGFPPGGTADLLTRLVCEWLQGRLGQAFVVENRPGAATNLATEAVARAPADGYTLLKTTTSNLLNGALFDDLKYDFVRDIAPVAAVSTQPLVLVVGTGVAARTVPQLIELARARPDPLNIGHSGTATISHLAAEAFRQQAGIAAVAVPYRGFAMTLADLLAGRVQATFDNLPAAMPHIRAGHLHALAVTTTQRSPVLPELPTVAETLPGFEAYAVAGIGAPRGTPADIVARLNAEINAGLADAALGKRLADLGATALPGTPADFASLIARETDKWGRLIRGSGIKLG